MAEPFAWWRIANGQAVAFVGANPPNKDTIWSPLYRAPVHTEHPDTERLRFVCGQMDGLGDRDFHAEACKLAGGGEPDGACYLMAYRAVVDTIRHSNAAPQTPSTARQGPDPSQSTSGLSSAEAASEPGISAGSPGGDPQ